MKSLQGHFLIAAGDLNDPNFFRTIVLMVQHNEQGALGLVVNRPTRATVKEVCDKLLEDVKVVMTGQVHHGGPCEGPLMIVHNDPDVSDIEITAGLHFTTDEHKLKWLLKHQVEKSMMFIGYSGWTAGQLENELATNSWLVAPAVPDDVFDPKFDWQRLMTRAKLTQYVPIDRIPDDPHAN